MTPSADVWITGARGFIGRQLALRLQGEGRRIAGIGHGAWPEAPDWGVSVWLNGEVSAANLSELLRLQGPPQTVFHLAGGSSVGASLAAPEEDFRRTVATTASLCEWLRGQVPDASLVAVSSAAVYGAGHEGPISETASCRPFSPYGHHKLMMEELCRSYAESFGLKVSIARLFSAYGPELRKQLLWDACRRLAAGSTQLELGGRGDEVRDWVHVSDVCRALIRLAQVSAVDAPTINVGTGEGIEVARIASLLAAAWGGGVETRFTGEVRKGDPKRLVADTRRAAALGMDWSIDPSDGVGAYVQWFKALARAT